MLGRPARISRQGTLIDMGQPQITILILGGYGVFGGRLAQLLRDLPELEILIAGRNLSRAEDFCTRYRG